MDTNSEKELLSLPLILPPLLLLYSTYTDLLPYSTVIQLLDSDTEALNINFQFERAVFKTTSKAAHGKCLAT